MGGIGSAIALKPGAFKSNKDGSFSGLSPVHVPSVAVKSNALQGQPLPSLTADLICAYE